MAEGIIEEIAEEQQQYRTTYPTYTATVFAERQLDCYKHQHEKTGNDRHRDIEIPAALLGSDGIDQCRETENDEGIDDV